MVVRSAFLSLLLASTAVAQEPPVQIVHPRRVQVRQLWRAAVRPFHKAGIFPRVVSRTPAKVPPAEVTGIKLLEQYALLVERHAMPGVRTVLLVPPTRDAYNRPVSSGVAPIGGGLAICTLTGSALLDVGCLAHELGHCLGATHRAEGIMSPAALGALYFAAASVEEMKGRM